MRLYRRPTLRGVCSNPHMRSPVHGCDPFWNQWDRTVTTRTNIMGRLLHKLSPKWEIVPEIAFVPLLIVYLLHSVVVCFGVCATKLSAITWIRLNYDT